MYMRGQHTDMHQTVMKKFQGDKKIEGYFIFTNMWFTRPNIVGICMPINVTVI